jgi:hypothetical protein
MTCIGAIALRLHGFHRFLPHLWELFYWARSVQTPFQQAAPAPGLGVLSLDTGPPRRERLAGWRRYRSWAPHNRHKPDFRHSLPVLLNWYERRIRYYRHVDLRANARCASGRSLPPR